MRKGGRAVYRGGLENRLAERLRGFESLPFRHSPPIASRNIIKNRYSVLSRTKNEDKTSNTKAGRKFTKFIVKKLHWPGAPWGNLVPLFSLVSRHPRILNVIRFIPTLHRCYQCLSFFLSHSKSTASAAGSVEKTAAFAAVWYFLNHAPISAARRSSYQGGKTIAPTIPFPSEASASSDSIALFQQILETQANVHNTIATNQAEGRAVWALTSM